VRALHDSQPGLKLTTLCRVLGVPRSTLYYQSDKAEDAAIRSAISTVAGNWPRYGSERITAQLRREGFTFGGKPVGERRVREIMRKMGLLGKPKKRRIRTTDSNHAHPRFPNLVKELEIKRPNQVWVSDITYIALGNGFVYLAVIMDVFTRSIRGWALSRGLDGSLTLLALQRALNTANAGKPEIHHSDQGKQYAAGEYVELLLRHGVAVSMAATGCPEENGFAERLMRTIKEEHVSLTHRSAI
jgi:putative transposase